MLHDIYSRVMDAQSITASLQVSEDSIDLETIGREIGTGNGLQFHVTRDETIDLAGSADRVDFEVIASSAAALNANIRVLTMVSVLATDMVAADEPGFRVVIPLPDSPIIKDDGGGEDVPANQWSGDFGHRYIGLRIVGRLTDGAGTITALTLTATLVPIGSDTTKKSYASGFTVS